jgi:hypothetical protein
MAISVLSALFSPDDKPNAKTGSAAAAEETTAPVDSAKIKQQQLATALTTIRTFKGGGYRGKITSIQLEVVLFNVWAKQAKEGLLSGDKKQVKLAGQLKAELAKLQAREFPKMREAYVAAVHQTMWENDIEVISLGDASSTIQFTGGIFARNANKQELQDKLSEILSALRFKRATYKWYEGDDGADYSLESFPDKKVSENLY